MSSIPLPALDVRPPAQQENPLDQYARIMQIKNAGLQQQAQQQQIQTGALQLQQEQQSQKDQMSFRAAMADPSMRGKSIGDIADSLASKGSLSPATYTQLKKTDVEQRQAVATLNDTDLKNAQAAHAQTQTLYNNVMNMSDGDLAQNWPSIAQQYDAIPGNQKMPMNPSQPLTKDQLKQFGPLISMQEGYLSAEAEKRTKQATIDKDSAQAAQANAAAAKDTAEVQNVTGPFADSKYRNIDMAMRLGRPVTADDKAFKTAYEDQKKIVPVATFNLQNAGATTPGPNGQPSALATAVANGQMKWGDVISPRTPMSVKQQFAAEVQKINPQFDTSTYGLETKAAEKATSGTWADTRLAYNTALDHSQLLIQAAKALQNGDVQALNSLKNKFGTEFGSTGPITFNAIANAYNHEVTSVVAKGHMTDKEVETGGASLPSNASMPQIMSVVGAYNSLMSSKRNELDKLIKASAGGKANGVLNTNSDSDSQPKPGSDPFAAFGGKSH